MYDSMKTYIFSIIYTRRFSGPGCQAAEEPAAEEALDHFSVVCNMAGLPSGND